MQKRHIMNVENNKEFCVLLKKIRRDYGDEIAFEPKRLKNILSDLNLKYKKEETKFMFLINEHQSFVKSVYKQDRINEEAIYEKIEDLCGFNSFWTKNVAMALLAIVGKEIDKSSSVSTSRNSTGVIDEQTEKPHRSAQEMDVAEDTDIRRKKCIEKFSDDSVIEGYKIGDVWDGPFKKTFPSGAYYTGVYCLGETKGDLTYVRTNGLSEWGCWENNNWNGRHIFENDDGSVIEGYMKNGIWEGDFKKTYKNGERYIGIYINGKAKGELTHIDENENSFTCIWENDNWNGKGVYRSNIGTLTGEWKNGEPVGECIYQYNSGQIYRGEIKNYCRSGLGTLWIPNLDITISGRYKYDKPDGRVRIEFSKAKSIYSYAVYDGEWHDCIDGDGVFECSQYKNFQKITCEGKWRNGMFLHGKLSVIYTNPNPVVYIYVGDFMNGVINGRGTLYTDDGEGDIYKLTADANWENNICKSMAFKSMTLKTGEKIISEAVSYVKEIVSPLMYVDGYMHDAVSSNERKTKDATEINGNTDFRKEDNNISNTLSIIGLWRHKNEDESSSYLRFFPDGTVVSVTSTGEPHQVIKWFGHDFEMQGSYRINDKYIEFQTTSKQGTVEYAGNIIDSNLMELNWHSKINGHIKKNVRYSYCFS